MLIPPEVLLLLRIVLISCVFVIPDEFVNCSLVQLEVRHGDSTRSSFIVENCVWYPSIFLIFQMNLQIALSNSLKYWVAIFDQDYIASIDFFCQTDIFTTLIVPIHEQGRFFQLLSSLISFFRDLKFLPYRFVTSLVRVTARYFIFLTIVNGVVSLISFLSFYPLCRERPLIYLS